MHVPYSRALSHSIIAPGYCLAQGRLAGTLPTVGLAVAATAETMAAGWTSGADALVAARHGRAAERYAALLGRSRGLVMKASKLLCLASVPPAGSPEHDAFYRSV